MRLRAQSRIPIGPVPAAYSANNARFVSPSSAKDFAWLAKYGSFAMSGKMRCHGVGQGCLQQDRVPARPTRALLDLVDIPSAATGLGCCAG